jgi:hypothetical protein
LTLDDNATLLPLQMAVEPPALITGVAGNELTVIAVAALAVLSQPLLLVVITV